jgi:hypothetical protein
MASMRGGSISDSGKRKSIPVYDNQMIFLKSNDIDRRDPRKGSSKFPPISSVWK